MTDSGSMTNPSEAMLCRECGADTRVLDEAAEIIRLCEEALEEAIAANSKARDMVPDEEDGLAAQVFAYHINAADAKLMRVLAQIKGQNP